LVGIPTIPTTDSGLNRPPLAAARASPAGKNSPDGFIAATVPTGLPRYSMTEASSSALADSRGDKALARATGGAGPQRVGF